MEKYSCNHKSIISKAPLVHSPAQLVHQQFKSTGALSIQVLKSPRIKILLPVLLQHLSTV